MGKRKGKKQSKSDKTGSKKLNSKLILLVVYLVFFGIVALALNGYVSQSNYFIIKNVEIYPFYLNTKSYAKGLTKLGMNENIINLNESGIKKYILEKYPDILDVTIIKKLPSTIIYNLTAREPVAQIKIEGKFYFADETSFILTDPSDNQRSDLIVIVGIENVEEYLGKYFKNPRLTNAINLIKAFQKTEFLKEFSVYYIDVSGYKSMSFLIDHGAEVKINLADYEKKIKLLLHTIKSKQLNLSEVDYVDLRFAHPVVKFR